MQSFDTRVLFSDAMNVSNFPTSPAAYILSGVNKPSWAERISLVVDPVNSGISPSRPFSDKVCVDMARCTLALIGLKNILRFCGLHRQ